MSMSSGPSKPQIATKASAPAARSFGRPANWTVGIAAAILVFISVGGYFYHREKLQAIAADHLRLVVTGPSVLQAGVATEYLISTTTIGQQPLAAQIEVVLADPDSQCLRAFREPADDRGRLRVTIPAELQLPAMTELRVVASHGNTREEAVLTLPVQPVRHAAFLTTDKPIYQPGETIHYRLLTLSQLRLMADRPAPARLEMLDSESKVVPGTATDAVAERGVCSGTFAIPRLAPGRYSLVACSPDQTFRDRMCSIRVVPPLSAAAPEKSPETGAGSPPPVAPAEPPRVNVRFFPEGGCLVASLENRVYFSAADVSDKPITLSGVIVAKGRGEGDIEREVATVETSLFGIGAFRMTPSLDEVYRLKVTSPPGVQEEPPLPKASAEQGIALASASGTFAAEKPIELALHAARSGTPLVAAAYCRGVEVAQQPLVTKQGVNPIVLSPDRSLGGVFRVVVFDYGDGSPKLAAERFVFRQPSRKLNVRIDGVKPRYAPDEGVELVLSVTNEKDEPVPALLGCVAVEDAAMEVPSDQMATATAEFLLADGLRRAKLFEAIGVDLSSEITGDVPPPVAVDLLLGAQDAPPSVPPPPAVFDNLARIRADYQRILTGYQADRTDALNTLTTASFFGGLGLVLLVAMLGLMRIVAGMHLWIPAIGAATCCLIIGAILMDPGRLSMGQDIAVAFSSYCAKQLDARKEATPQIAPAANPNPQADATEPFGKTIFCNPMLVAGSDGKATIRFDLPKAAGKVRVTIDAHADGRLGAASAALIVGDAP